MSAGWVNMQVGLMGLGWVEIFCRLVGWVGSWVSVGKVVKIKLLQSATLVSKCNVCGHDSVLKGIVIVPETSSLVLFGCRLGWVVGPNLSFVMGWIGS